MNFYNRFDTVSTALVAVTATTSAIAGWSCGAILRAKSFGPFCPALPLYFYFG